MNFVDKMIERFIKVNKRMKRWQRTVSVLSAIVVFIVTYSLVLPAITLDKETASTQAGMEIAASENEADSDGTVYEAEPEEAEEPQEEEPQAEEPQEEEPQAEEPQAEEPVAEDSGSESGSQEAETTEEEPEQSEEDATAPVEAEESEDKELDTASDEGAAEVVQEENDASTEKSAIAATDEQAEEISLITEHTQLVYEYVDEDYFDSSKDDDKDDSYTVYAEFGEDAKLPVGVELKAEEITKESDPDAYEAYYQKALSEMKDRYDENTGLSFAKFYDIAFIYNGAEVEPSGNVSVRIEYSKAVEVQEDITVDTVHFDKNDNEKAEVIDSSVDSEKQGDEDTVRAVEFESDKFSVYGVIGSGVITTTLLTAKGETYKVTVTYDEKAEIPNGTKLVVKEIEQGSAAYIDFYNQTWLTLNKDYFEEKEKQMQSDGDSAPLSDRSLINLGAARYFDISLVFEEKEIEPVAPVQVQLEYVKGAKLDTDSPITGIVHFTDDEVEIIDPVEVTKSEDGSVNGFVYKQDSFSASGSFLAQEASNGKLSLPTPSLKLSNSDSLGKPEGHKTLTNNKDGTYTLELSVKGAKSVVETTDVQKSNVLIVMDRSSSMKRKVAQYTEFTGTPVTGTVYYGATSSEYFELTFEIVDGVVHYYTGEEEYTGTVYTKQESTETRLEDEQGALDQLVTSLLSKNKPGETVIDSEGNPVSLDDVIEISVISFADQALEGQASEVSWSLDHDTLMAGINQTNTPTGTNWEDALKYAKSVADAKASDASQQGEDTYIVFLTDGEPTAIAGESIENNEGGAHHYDQTVNGVSVPYYDGHYNTGTYAAEKFWGRDDNVGGFNYALTGTGSFYSAFDDGETALSRAQTLVDSNYKFFGIFTYGTGQDQFNYLRRLVNYAYGNGDSSSSTEELENHFYTADNASELTKIFETIFMHAMKTQEHSNVKITDGMTTDAMTSTVVAGDTAGIKYIVSNGDETVYTVTSSGSESSPTVKFEINGTSHAATKKEDDQGRTYYSVTVDGTEYKMTLASKASDGTLTWDLSAIGTLADGYTYAAEIVVWPNQKAYDYVAALNNGLEGYTWDTSVETAENHNDQYGYWPGGVTKYPSIVKFDDGTFGVLTNTEQKVDYSVQTTLVDDEGNTTVTTAGPYSFDLELPKPMELTSTDSSIEKQWNVDRNPEELAYLLYNVSTDGSSTEYQLSFDVLQGTSTTPYTTVTLGWDETQQKYIWKEDSEQTVTIGGNNYTVGTNWTKDFAIATGLMLDEEHMDAHGLDKTKYPHGTYNGDGKTYYVLETGHDYTIEEPTLSYEYDFTSTVYHPMLVNNVLQSVLFTENDDGTITISDMTTVEGGISSLKVENTLRGYIELNKKVVDANGTSLTSDETKFEYEIELANSNDPFVEEHIPWYGVNGLYYHDADFNYYQAVATVVGHLNLTDESGTVYDATCSGTFDPDVVGPTDVTYNDGTEDKTIQLYGNQMTANSTSDVVATLKINQQETLTIANVPMDTIYKITESEQRGYELVKIEKEIKIGDSADSEYEKETVTGSAEISGTIVPNRDNHVTYTNKCRIIDITVQKLDESGNGLEGAVFQLKKVNGSEEMDVEGISELGEVTKGDVTYTSAFETTGEVQQLSEVEDGTYRLYEVYAPDGYIITFKYIQFDITNRVMQNVTTDTGDTSKIEFEAAEDNKLALLKISNEPGAELPHTGGSGTLIYIIGGLALVMASTLIYGLRLKS